MAFDPIRVDEWPWGRELIIWGYDPTHLYTFKILEPKQGRTGCLSLQYHHIKSESWLVLRGVAWALLVLEGLVCTRIMRAGEIQNLPTGTIHRLMALSSDLQVAEPSTPDKHAADKSVPKDVVRLHCFQGRECQQPSDQKEAQIIKRCIELSEEAILACEQGREPPQHNLELLKGSGAFKLA